MMFSLFTFIKSNFSREVTIMQLNLLSKATIGISVLIGAISTFTQPVFAQERFDCDTTQMSTTVRTERGSIPLIRWTDNSFPPPFSPQQRCEIVSERFRKFDNNGTLKYIKADTINNLPALCVAAYKGGSCLPNGLLVTLKPGADANQTLLKILDRRVWASGGTIQLSSKDNEESVVSQVEGETYVDMEAFFSANSSSSLESNPQQSTQSLW